jgi:hypothetical protein
LQPATANAATIGARGKRLKMLEKPIIYDMATTLGVTVHIA